MVLILQWQCPVNGILGRCLVISVNYAIVVGLTGKDMADSSHLLNYVRKILQFLESAPNYELFFINRLLFPQVKTKLTL